MLFWLKNLGFAAGVQQDSISIDTVVTLDPDVVTTPDPDIVITPVSKG